MTDTAHPAVPAITPETIEQLREIVGPDGVVLQQDLMSDPAWPLRDPFFIPGDESHTAGVAVHASSTEQVQAILAVANEAGIPVWPHGQGRNNAYGGPSPRVPGSISISLRRMNRILEIDEELAYAVVEPGVRWVDLDDELRRRGSRLALSVPDIGWGSIIGNSLDNGSTYLPLGSDHSAPCGLEVVLADGTLMRTGMGAMPGNKAWHVYKRGVGPVLDPLFAQSNFGIVTQMGVWLMPRPEVYAPILLTAPDAASLPAVVDTVRELRLTGVIRGVPAIYSSASAPLFFPGVEGVTPELLLGPSEARDRFLAAHHLGEWNVRAGLYGTAEIVDASVLAIERAWSAVAGGAVHVEGRYAPDEYDTIEATNSRISAGIPTTKILEMMPPGIGHVDVSPVVPMDGRQVADVLAAGEEVYRRTGLGGGVTAYALSERSCIVIFAFVFDTDDADEARLAFDTGSAFVDELAAMGYTEYRAHLTLMDHVAEKFSFGDHAYRRFCEAIKDAVDPNGILSPGRYGIWPRSMRA